MSDTRILPMFPLGTTLLPGMALPLRLFEPRYLQMYADIIDEEREFGVVLIERGIESHDDNPTYDIGCTAYVVGSGVHEDGTLALVAIGRNRLRVLEWQESDPYPLALVQELDDEPLTEEGMGALESAANRLPALIAVAAELNPELNADAPELSEDPVQAIYQLAQLAGLQAFDLQKVLETETTDARVALVDELMSETMEMIQLQLRMG
ncbi:MAG TPA: LON peptidase substrate-binding domain-containing protein [Acidimicrobiia bacterium]|nr:LON peptidase substrate-binding domain-containing protein [Acidimicrobiia bacterium]